MNKIELLDFIKKNTNWREILTSEPYNIKIKNKDDLTILKYDQLNTTKWDELSLWCRGIIINNKSLEPVCVPFKKFFNYGEPYADEIDLDSARVTEKIDGSLIKIFFYNGVWRIATNGAIDADEIESIEVNGMGHGPSFGKITRQALGNFNLNTLDKHSTHMFELTSPYNIVVLNYGDKPELYYLGSRHLNDFMEYQEQTAREYFKTPQLYDFDKVPLSMIKEAIKDKENFEGFVIVDKDCHRVKIKTEDYLMRHHARSKQITPKAIIQILQANEMGEFLSNVDESTPIKEMIEILETNYENLIKEIDSYAHMLKTKFGNDARSAAIFAQSHPYLGWVMGAFRYGSCRNLISKVSAKKLVELLYTGK